MSYEGCAMASRPRRARARIVSLGPFPRAISHRRKTCNWGSGRPSPHKDEHRSFGIRDPKAAAVEAIRRSGCQAICRSHNRGPFPDVLRNTRRNTNRGHVASASSLATPSEPSTNIQNRTPCYNSLGTTGFTCAPCRQTQACRPTTRSPSSSMPRASARGRPSSSPTAWATRRVAGLLTSRAGGGTPGWTA